MSHSSFISSYAHKTIDTSEECVEYTTISLGAASCKTSSCFLPVLQKGGQAKWVHPVPAPQPSLPPPHHEGCSLVRGPAGEAPAPGPAVSSQFLSLSVTLQNTAETSK